MTIKWKRSRKPAGRKIKIKNPLKVIMGKRNRRSGKAFEKKVLNRLIALGLPAYQTPMSGSLKASGLIPQLRDNLAADLQVVIKDEKYLIECKHMATHAKLFDTIADDDCYHYEGFCYMFSDSAFLSYILGDKFNVVEKEDKRNKWLHKFFEQDNSHMVVLGQNYKDNIYCVREDAFDAFKHSVKVKGVK